MDVLVVVVSGECGIGCVRAGGLTMLGLLGRVEMRRARGWNGFGRVSWMGVGRVV